MCIVLPFLCSSVQHFIQYDKENAIWHQIFASPSESRDYDIPTAKRECRHECLKKPNWGTSGRKQWRSQLTYCPSNLSLLAQKTSLISAIKRQCCAIIIVYIWTYVRNLNYLLFGTEFFIAILKAKVHIYKQIHIQKLPNNYGSYPLAL